MKNFNEFLSESRKQYQFRVKIAGLVPDKQLDKIETALQKWGLISLSAPKTTPIQKSPTDFPLLKEMEVTIMDLTLDYPATAHEIAIRLNQYTEIPQDYIKVCPEHDSEEMEKEEESVNPLLLSPYPKSEEKKNPHYGEKFIKEFLKTEKKVPYSYKIAGGKEPKAKTTNDIPQNVVSPVNELSKNKVRKAK